MDKFTRFKFQARTLLERKYKRSFAVAQLMKLAKRDNLRVKEYYYDDQLYILIELDNCVLEIFPFETFYYEIWLSFDP